MFFCQPQGYNSYMQERYFNLDALKTKSIRSQRGLQSDIARALNISRQSINDKLRGEKGISERHLDYLCRAAGVESGDILTDESKKFLVSLSTVS